MRRLKFVNDRESGNICRWLYAGIKVDIMPDDASAIGFTNQWYHDGMKNAINYPIEENLTIRIFAPAWFLASKIVAFEDRGKGHYRTSSDFEDIVYVLDNRMELLNDLRLADEKVLRYLQSKFHKYLSDKGLKEGISCALPYGSGEERIERIRLIMEQIVKSD